MRRLNCLHIVVSIGTILGLSAPAWAVPYASGVHTTTGTTREFVLNESADNVTVMRDGGNALDMGALAAGRYTFDLGAFSTFDIKVSKNTVAGYTRLSDKGNAFTRFERPYGLTVNTDPSSPFFGTVYVNNSNTASTGSGRAMGDGIYALTADLKGVNLASNLAVVTDANDTTQAKAPGWAVGGSTNSAFHISLDAAGNIIAGDWSDANGSIKYASADLTTGGLILENGGVSPGARPLYLDIATGTHEIHGSSVSTPYTTGSVGNNLVVYAMDEDYDLDGDTFTAPGATSGNHVWKWNVGDVTEYDGAPQLVVSATALATANSDGSPAFLDLNVGVLADAYYSPQFNKWYLTQGRSDGNESSIAIVTPDGGDGLSPTLEWSSKDFSIAHNLDGFTDIAEYAGSTGLQDIFRTSGAVTISDDGTKMYVHRGVVWGNDIPFNAVANPGVMNDNPYLGRQSSAPGAILVIPLDANGLPDVQVDDNGTPEDPSDDVITNIESITTELNNPVGDYNGDFVVNAADYTVWRDTLSSTTDLRANGDNTLTSAGVIDAADYEAWKTRFGNTGIVAGHSRVPIILDAAGNIYITNHGKETLEVYSPGGNTVATTSSNGTFDLQTLGGSGAGVVPEPGAGSLMAIGLLLVGWFSGPRPRKTMV